MKKINWGIIGLGNIAHEFSKAFAETNNAKLLAISSKDKNKLKNQCGGVHHVAFWVSQSTIRIAEKI